MRGTAADDRVVAPASPAATRSPTPAITAAACIPRIACDGFQANVDRADTLIYASQENLPARVGPDPFVEIGLRSFTSFLIASMKKKPQRAIVEVDLVSRDGRVLLNGQALDLGLLIVHDEISRGANGVVFVATDPVLNRRVAVKFWIALRSGDSRNKVEQGLAESRKTWDAQRTEVAKVYFAGSVNNVFYTVMELIEGSTLNTWLKEEKPSLGARCYVAEQIINLDVELQQHGVIHGDLHGGNVMVVEDVTPRSYFDISKHKRWNIKLLDFGTSTYSGREASRKRHYRVLEKTIDQCIAPFALSKLEASPKPESQDLSTMQEWMLRGLYAIRAALYESRREYVGWPLFRSFGMGMLTTQGFGLSTVRVRELLEAFISTGTVEPTREAIGATAEWGPFDGRTAKRND